MSALEGGAARGRGRTAATGGAPQARDPPPALTARALGLWLPFLFFAPHAHSTCLYCKNHKQYKRIKRASIRWQGLHAALHLRAMCAMRVYTKVGLSRRLAPSCTVAHDSYFISFAAISPVLACDSESSFCFAPTCDNDYSICLVGNRLSRHMTTCRTLYAVSIAFWLSSISALSSQSDPSPGGGGGHGEAARDRRSLKAGAHCPCSPAAKAQP